jgi:hypothetical protein
MDTKGARKVAAALAQQLKDLGISLQEFFDQIDIDKSGKVSIKEIGINFKKIRIFDTTNAIRLFDKDGDW